MRKQTLPTQDKANQGTETVKHLNLAAVKLKAFPVSQLLLQ
jgi:hypothetical protein